MPDTRERANTDQVHDQLRADILGGIHAPGEKLRFAGLASQYGASVGVLREALTRLTEQGLVRSVPRIGFTVTPLTREDLDDLTTVRIQIESLALRGAIEHGTMEWESALVAAHHTLNRTPVLTDEPPVRVSDDWERAHSAFHRVLISACGSPRLLGIAETLRHSSELYRRWSQPREKGRDVSAEHRAIMDAALTRDAELASDLLRKHFQHTADILRRDLSEGQ